jgi:hypothetical protein
MMRGGEYVMLSAKHIYRTFQGVDTEISPRIVLADLWSS